MAPSSVVEYRYSGSRRLYSFSLDYFFAFKVSIDGFLYGCKPYISIDSTHLNGECNGQMPTTLALYGIIGCFP
jgi:hypothetical protein